MKELPALLESVMESALSNDIDASWLVSGFDKYSVLLDSIRRDVSYLGAANQNQGLDDQLGRYICEDQLWRCLIQCFCNQDYYFSMDELLLICRFADIRVVIFKAEGNVLKHCCLPICLQVNVSKKKP